MGFLALAEHADGVVGPAPTARSHPITLNSWSTVWPKMIDAVVRNTDFGLLQSATVTSFAYSLPDIGITFGRWTRLTYCHLGRKHKPNVPGAQPAIK